MAEPSTPDHACVSQPQPLTDQHAKLVQSRFTSPHITQEPKFSSTDHLSAEAIVCFMDSNLSAKAMARAEKHVAQCAHCRHQLQCQQASRNALQSCEPVSMPSSLHHTLSQIPHRTAPEMDPGRTSGIARAARHTLGWVRSRNSGEDAAERRSRAARAHLRKLFGSDPGR